MTELQAKMIIDYRTFLKVINDIGYDPINIIENKIGIALGNSKVVWIPFELEWEE